MKIVVTWGQLRVEMCAEHKLGQRSVDVVANGAARPRTLIARSTLDPDHGWGNKWGRCMNGVHFARCIGPRRLTGILYHTDSGLPIGQRMLHAPKFAWWPQHRGATARQATTPTTIHAI